MASKKAESAKISVESAEVRAESANPEHGSSRDGGSVKMADEWVEWVDSLGRSRRCLKEELPEMMRKDRDMASAKKHSERLACVCVCMCSLL